MKNNCSQPFYKVLILDEDLEPRIVSKQILKDYYYQNRGIDLHFSRGIDDSLSILQKQKVAVAILNFNAEDVNRGLTMIRKLRKDPEQQEMQVILVTHYPSRISELEMVESYNVNGFIKDRDLMSQQLVITLTIALRAYEQILMMKERCQQLRRYKSFYQESIKSWEGLDSVKPIYHYLLNHTLVKDLAFFKKGELLFYHNNEGAFRAIFDRWLLSGEEIFDHYLILRFTRNGEFVLVIQLKDLSEIKESIAMHGLSDPIEALKKEMQEIFSNQKLLLDLFRILSLRKQILHIESQGRKVVLNLTRNRKEVIGQQIKTIAPFLNNIEFVRINRSIIIHLHRIKSWDFKSSRDLKVETQAGDTFNVSRSNIARVNGLLGTYKNHMKKVRR